MALEKFEEMGQETVDEYLIARREALGLRPGEQAPRGGGDLSFADFVAFLEDYLPPLDRGHFAKQSAKAFRLVDRDGKGRITFLDLKDWNASAANGKCCSGLRVADCRLLPLTSLYCISSPLSVP